MDDVNDDALITALIQVATEQAEKYMDWKVSEREYDIFFDNFPGGYGAVNDPDYDSEMDYYINSGGKIQLPFGNHQSLDAFNTFGEDDVAVPFSSSNFSFDPIEGRIGLKMGAVWPATILRPVNGIAVSVTAGYADAAAVPDDIKQAILQIVGKLYEHRGDDKENDMDFSLPYTAIVLLGTYRRYKVGC